MRARQVADIFDDQPTDIESDHDGDSCTSIPSPHVEAPASFRVQINQSPYMDMFYGHHTTRVTIDSGATGNMIRASTAKRLGAHITESSQSAHQADGSSPLTITGETRLRLTRDNHTFMFEGLVVDNLDVDILAGTPFMSVNDIAIRPAKRLITLGDGSAITYGSPKGPSTSNAVRRAHVLRAPTSSTTVWPGEFIELTLPKDIQMMNFLLLSLARTQPGQDPISHRGCGLPPTSSLPSLEESASSTRQQNRKFSNAMSTSAKFAPSSPLPRHPM